MINLLTQLDQIAIAFFAVVVMCYSFRSLNCCTEHTEFFVRLSSVLFFTSSAGAILLVVSSVHIGWPFGLFIAASALHLATDRREYFINDLYSNPFRK